jgi:16S rRNA (cytidine1402-2'-O)-methyltransferase
MTPQPGTLFIVATPIGNLEDLTFRALRTLREVDLIAAEDTRRTSKLLAHYEVRKPLVSLREHNEARFGPAVVARIAAGESAALVTDAGTPGISDPGAHLVALARTGGVRVVPIPGCSAVATALSVSGLPAASFLFAGFPPPTGAARQRWFAQLSGEPRTIVVMEAPHRIERTLKDAAAYLAERPIIVARELTKQHEELVEYHIQRDVEPRGEFVLVIGPIVHVPGPQSNTDDLVELYNCLTESIALSREDALNLLARAVGSDPQAVRKRIKKARILVERRNRV